MLKKMCATYFESTVDYSMCTAHCAVSGCESFIENNFNIRDAPCCRQPVVTNDQVAAPFMSPK